MSLLEWFLEPMNPGPVGNIDFNSDEPEQDDEPPKKWLIWLRTISGLALFGIGLYWVFYNIAYTNIGLILIKLGSLFLYILLSHLINAQPDYSNVGWLGGLIDNPFRISDDYNRWVVYLQALLLPGKLIAYSLAMSWWVSQYFWRKFRK